MTDPLFWHRLQFGFTITYHYLFPQLTMGLALLIVVMKAVALRTGKSSWNDAARFWIRIFGLNFAMGVVTGVPMEFQFGTNWAAFSRRTGDIIGQTLAMEGIFAFFLESSFLALLVWGERRLGPRKHFLAALALFVGSWLSGYFIIATNAFLQHPQGHELGADGVFRLRDLGAFVGRHFGEGQPIKDDVALCDWLVEHARALLSKTGELFFSTNFLGFELDPYSILVPFLVAAHQPASLAAMEGRFESGGHAPLAMIGQPNVAARRLDNPIHLPSLLSWIAYGDFSANVQGLNDFPERDWPGNVELLYYAFHIMVGLGTLFIAVMGMATLLLWRGLLERSRFMLWVLVLAFPFPYIANTAGWLTAELGRQRAGHVGDAPEQEEDGE